MPMTFAHEAGQPVPHKELCVARIQILLSKACPKTTKANYSCFSTTIDTIIASTGCRSGAVFLIRARAHPLRIGDHRTVPPLPPRRLRLRALTGFHGSSTAFGFWPGVTPRVSLIKPDAHHP
jgi:hypothetical protein